MPVKFISTLARLNGCIYVLQNVLFQLVDVGVPFDLDEEYEANDAEVGYTLHSEPPNGAILMAWIDTEGRNVYVEGYCPNDGETPAVLDYKWCQNKGWQDLVTGVDDKYTAKDYSKQVALAAKAFYDEHMS